MTRTKRQKMLRAARRNRPVSSCPSGKTCYASEMDAKLALLKIQRQDKPGHLECRAYHHRLCHQWHLTSHEYRRRKPE